MFIDLSCNKKSTTQGSTHTRNMIIPLLSARMSIKKLNWRVK